VRNAVRPSPHDRLSPSVMSRRAYALPSSAPACGAIIPHVGVAGSNVQIPPPRPLIFSAVLSQRFPLVQLCTGALAQSLVQLFLASERPLADGLPACRTAFELSPSQQPPRAKVRCLRSRSLAGGGSAEYGCSRAGAARLRCLLDANLDPDRSYRANRFTAER
jgi:hypothetical protein